MRVYSLLFIVFYCFIFSILILFLHYFIMTSYKPGQTQYSSEQGLGRPVTIPTAVKTTTPRMSIHDLQLVTSPSLVYGQGDGHRLSAHFHGRLEPSIHPFSLRGMDFHGRLGLYLDVDCSVHLTWQTPLVYPPNLKSLNRQFRQAQILDAQEEIEKLHFKTDQSSPFTQESQKIWPKLCNLQRVTLFYIYL